MKGRARDRRAALACTLAQIALSASAVLGAGAEAVAGEWRARGGDRGESRYSPLAQIASGNLRELRIVWEWISADAGVAARSAGLRLPINLEGTPLMIGGVLYGTTSFGLAFALDASSGRELWVYDPKGYEGGRPPNFGFVNRGLAYWTDGSERRLFLGTPDARLVALDPATGQPIPSFGDGGVVDTREGIPRLTNARAYGFTSAPTVCRDVVTMGASITDGSLRRAAPPGWVRGWDARTGALRWTFHSIPLEGEPGNETWEDGSWRWSGNTNVWSLVSADEELGRLYLPFGTPNNDYYGGARLGDNLYAESLVCLECETGRRVWHFQAVHHGLWDYDLPAAPVLADLVVAGRPVEALAQVSKQGFVYVLDRVTGEPVWPIVERPVPPSTVPGERAAPTQPFPTRPPPFERQGVTEDDLIDLTPELRAEALAIFERFEHGPLFTPPSLRGTLTLPAQGGGANWPGAALDPESSLLYVPSMTRPMVNALGEPDPARSDHRYVRVAPADANGPQGLPLVKPPWGRVTAIDLSRGEIVWMVPNGGPGPIDHPAIRHLHLAYLGTPGRAQVLVTRTLLFVSEGSGMSSSAIGGGNGLRALDKRTGKELWRIELAGQVSGGPMTYEWRGVQYLVVPVASDPPRLVALAVEAPADGPPRSAALDQLPRE